MSLEEREILGVSSCKSVLVCTGVFNGNNGNTEKKVAKSKQAQKMNYRDIIMDTDLRIADETVPDVLQAVKTIFTAQRVPGFS